MGFNQSLDEFEVEKKKAIERSKATGAGVDEAINLDVHGIAHLQEQGIPPTDDSSKQEYSASCCGKYTFSSISSKVIAIRYGKSFHDSAESGDIGLVMEKTNCYAEQGGQIYDTGFATKDGDDDFEFAIKNVQIRGGYILHIGKGEKMLFEIYTFFQRYIGGIDIGG